MVELEVFSGEIVVEIVDGTVRNQWRILRARSSGRVSKGCGRWSVPAIHRAWSRWLAQRQWLACSRVTSGHGRAGHVDRWARENGHGATGSAVAFQSAGAVPARLPEMSLPGGCRTVRCETGVRRSGVEGDQAARTGTARRASPCMVRRVT
jgi:hypothetical protein